MLQNLGGSILSRDPIFNMFSKFLLAQLVHRLVFIHLHKVWKRCFYWLQFGCLNVAWWFWVRLQVESFSCLWNLWFFTSSPHNLLLSNLIYLIVYVFTQYFFCSITKFKLLNGLNYFNYVISWAWYFWVSAPSFNLFALLLSQMASCTYCDFYQLVVGASNNCFLFVPPFVGLFLQI